MVWRGQTLVGLGEIVGALGLEEDGKIEMD